MREILLVVVHVDDRHRHRRPYGDLPLFIPDALIGRDARVPCRDAVRQAHRLADASTQVRQVLFEVGPVERGLWVRDRLAQLRLQFAQRRGGLVENVEGRRREGPGRRL